jgi:meiotic recombination protein SPO11
LLTDRVPAPEVAAAIEQVMVAVAKNILDGEGFGYSLPSRGSTDQVYLEQLDRIVLKVGGGAAQVESRSHP